MLQIDDIRTSDTDKSAVFGERCKQLRDGHSDLDHIPARQCHVLIVIVCLRVHHTTCIDALNAVFGFKLDHLLTELLGAHEGYALSYPLSDYTLEFDTDEKAPVYSDVFTPIDEKSVSYNENGALVLNFRTEQFEGGSMLFHPVNANSVTMRNSHDKKSVTVDISECEYLVFWTISGAPFFCIEPWMGNSDKADFTGEISEREGIVSLASGDAYSFTHTITFNN